jgi:hypothetical protein
VCVPRRPSAIPPWCADSHLLVEAASIACSSLRPRSRRTIVPPLLAELDPTVPGVDARVGSPRPSMAACQAGADLPRGHGREKVGPRSASKGWRMESSRPTRVLIVANRTAATPRLLEAVTQRRRSGRCEFALLVPNVTGRKAVDWTLESALPRLRRAGRGRVEGLVGGPDPFTSVQKAVLEGDFDEIIVSTVSKGVSKWLRRDLITRIKGLGLPVTAIVPRSGKVSSKEALKTMVEGGPRLTAATRKSPALPP